MPLTQVLVTLIVVGVLLWLVNRFIPMAGSIKSILNAVVVIAVVLWLLSAFGLLSSLGARETGGRVALPVFREIMLGIYRENIMGPVPEFPPQMEQSINAYLQGDSVVPASDANRPTSETKFRQREINGGEKRSPQVQPGAA
jgi:membrane carboxypeptidase/penicillin-binding protein